MPTSTFSSSDDAAGGLDDAVAGGWPIASPWNFGDWSTNAELFVDRTLSGGFYFVFETFLRFDTSSLPDGAVITAATLEMYLTERNQADAGRTMLGEFYDYGGGAVVEADMAITTTFDAFSVTSDSLGSAGSVKTITISDLSGISTTGFTGLRLKHGNLTGAPTPTGNNNIKWAATEHATGQEPRLNVTYTEAPTFRFDYSEFPKPKLRSAVPVRW